MLFRLKTLTEQPQAFALLTLLKPLAALGALGLLACAPEGTRVKDDGPKKGVFEGYSIVFSIPGTTTAAPTGSAASGASAATASPVGAAPKTRPPTSYCIEFPTGSTIDAANNAYNCNLFEYATNGDAKVMTSSVWNNGKGAPSKCSFSGTPGTLNFKCSYEYLDKTTGTAKKQACSSYPEGFQDPTGEPAALIQVLGTAAPFQARSAAPQGLSAAGLPFPIAENISVEAAGCATGNAKFAPPSPQQVVPVVGNPQQPQPTGTATVTYELNASKAINGTALKSSTEDSSKLTEGSTKCTIPKPSTGPITLVAEPMTAAAPAGLEKYYVVAKLVSITGSTVDCANFKSQNPTTILLFRDHWIPKN